MKQYNRIMLGEHGKHIADCLENNSREAFKSSVTKDSHRKKKS